MKICIICLRVDRELKPVDSALVEFHDEICDFSLPTDVHYCNDCERLLRKFYKFHKQCVRALKIYLRWKSMKVSKRPPLTTLHTLLLPSEPNNEPDSLTTQNVSQNDSHPVSDSKENMRQKDVPELKTVSTKAPSERTNMYPSKEIHPILEIEEIKQEIDDDRTYSITIKDFKQNADLSTNANDVDDQNVNVKSENNPKPEEKIKEEKDEHNKLEKDHEKLVNDEKIDEVETDDEDFLDSLEGTGLAHGNSDDDEDDLKSNDGKKQAKPEGKYRRRRKPLNIEKLKRDLKKKLSACNDVTAKDGTPIDKDYIIQNLEDKVAYHDLRSLRVACRAGSKKLEEALRGFYVRFKEDDQFQSMFDIQYLSTYEMKVEEFKKRKTYHSYVNAEFKCDKCYTPFKGAKELDNHRKEHHEENSETAGECCPICNVRTSKRKKNAHYSTHAAVYKCKLCPMVTHYRYTMKTHFAMHSGKIYTCKECDTSFKWQSAYSLHMSKYHRRKEHVCTTCGRGFLFEHALNAHAKKHQDEPAVPTEGAESVSCAECDVTFPSQAVYAAHVTDAHTVPRSLKREPDGLPAYKNVNIGPRLKSRGQHKVHPVKCKLCNKVRLGSVWLKTHFKREHPGEDLNMMYSNVKKHLCEICGKGFASAYTLRDHMNMHTDTRPYPCDMCPKRFHSSMAMRVHRTRHFPPTDLCTLCGKKFMSKSDLYKHMKIHTAEKKHKCEYCEKRFKFSKTLEEHMRDEHNIRRVRRRAAARKKERVEQMDLEHEAE